MSNLLSALNAESYDRQYSDMALLRRILSHLRHERALLGWALGSVVLSTLLGLAVPLTVSALLARLGRAGGLEVWLIVGVAAAGALGWVLQYGQRLLVRRATTQVVYRIQTDTFAAVLERESSFFGATSHGQLVSRITGDTQAFAVIVNLLLSLLNQLALVVGILAVLWWTNAALAAAMTALVPVVVAVATLFRVWARRTTTLTRRALAGINAAASEAISGLTVAKNYGQEPLLLSEFQQMNAVAFRLQVRQGMVYSAIYPLLGLVTGLVLALVALFGGQLVLQGAMNVGEWYLFVQALDFFIMPLTVVAAFWSQFQQGLASAERVFALLDTPQEQPWGTLPVPAGPVSVTFESVGFHYAGGQPVLTSFSLDLQPGETVALTGPTGAGKSTVVKLLIGDLTPTQGAIRLAGQPLSAYNRAELRQHIGYVSQTPFLFAGTVLDNIRLGRLSASDEDVQRAAEALLPGWVDQLSGGLATKVGERGQGISAGQRQLVVLARIMLQNPGLLVLDEATANLDPLTELQILQALVMVQRGRACLYVAHRLAAAAHADRVVELREHERSEAGIRLDQRSGLVPA